MNETNTEVVFNISCSDNSHIFGRPMRLEEGFDGYMDIPILNEAGEEDLSKLDEWCEKLAGLSFKGFDHHFHFVKE